MVLMGTFLWLGWLVWAVMLYMMGATKGLSVPNTVLSNRAKMVAFLALLAFVFSFMIRPVQLVQYTVISRLLGLRSQNELDCFRMVLCCTGRYAANPSVGKQKDADKILSISKRMLRKKRNQESREEKYLVPQKAIGFVLLLKG